MRQYNLLGFIILILDNSVKFAKQNVGKQRRTGTFQGLLMPRTMKWKENR